MTFCYINGVMSYWAFGNVPTVDITDSCSLGYVLHRRMNDYESYAARERRESVTDNMTGIFLVVYTLH